jgi:hypothetical protein
LRRFTPVFLVSLDMKAEPPARDLHAGIDLLKNHYW